MEKEIKIQNNVMPRFFVDRRIGCIAIIDSQHPDFDKEYEGLNVDMPFIVKFQMGDLSRDGWNIKEDVVRKFNSECFSLNNI